MQYYIVIPDQDLRDRIGPAAAGPEGRGLVLSTDTWVPEAHRDWTVTVTWTDTHDEVHVHLEDLDWGLDMAADFDDTDTDDWHRLGVSVAQFPRSAGDWLDPDDETIPAHVREEFDLDLD